MKTQFTITFRTFGIRFAIFLMLVSTMLLTSCASLKSKKCGCPTFGTNKKHAQIYQAKENKNPI